MNTSLPSPAGRRPFSFLAALGRCARLPRLLGLLVPLLGLLAPLAAHAQSTTYLSSIENISNSAFVIASDFWHAQRFVTGPNPLGYDLDAIKLLMARMGGNPGPFSLRVYTDNGGLPGSNLGTLSGPDPNHVTNEEKVYAYTATGITLAPATTYWLVATAATHSSSGFYRWLNSWTTGYASSGGWSIPQGIAYSANGTSWGLHANSFPLLFEMLATPVQLTGQYFQDFSTVAVGATELHDGSELVSDHLGTVAAVQDATHKELALTDHGTGGTRSAFRLRDLNPGTPVYAFSARWNSQVYANFTDAADGFSFNFGPLGALDLVNATATQEDGYGTGLSFGVRTFVDNAPGFYLRVNGSVVASVLHDPTVQWGDFNSKRHLFEVDWSHVGGLTVRVDGVAVFTDVPTPGFTPQAGDRFVWAARTGGFAEQVRLDNVLVLTGGRLARLTTGAPYFKDGENAPLETADMAFDGNLATKWLTFSDPAGFVGATVSGSRTVRAYALHSAADAPDRDPLAWTLEGSNDGGANWSPAGSGGGRFLNRGETRFWMGTGDDPFGAFRLNISANNGGPEIQLAELALYEFQNAAPAAGPDTVTRGPGRTVKVPVSTLLANDADSDALSLTAVTSPTANGATVRLVGDFVVYEADAGDTDDSFTYTVSDGENTAFGTVTVTVAEPETPTQNVTGTLLTGPSGSEQMQVGAAGIPGRSYVLQTTGSLTSPVTWTDLGSAQVAPANGQMQFNDPAPETPRFYRVIEATTP